MLLLLEMGVLQAACLAAAAPCCPTEQLMVAQSQRQETAAQVGVASLPETQARSGRCCWLARWRLPAACWVELASASVASVGCREEMR